jgi:hypothetical protein
MRTTKIYVFICRNCGKQHSTSYKDRTTYCSRECSDAHIERRNCECCGKEFDARLQRKQKFCSTCKSIANHRRNNNVPLDTPLPNKKKCIICGIVFMQINYKQKTCGRKVCQRYYGNQLSKDNYYKKYIATYVPKICICKECGKTFDTEYLNKHRDYCSDKHMQKHGKRIGRAIRRIRIRGAKHIEYFDPFYIFRRDKWHCQLCGVKTPKRLRGTIDNDAPELDHIVPIALGGEHTIANAQCLCRKCNQKKGATIKGQLRLI